MNVKQVFMRAVISAAVLWSAYWGWTYTDANQDAQSWQEIARLEANQKASDPTTGDPNHPRFTREGAEFWTARINAAVEHRDRRQSDAHEATDMLWKGLLGIFLLSGAVAWTYLGLRKPVR